MVVDVGGKEEWITTLYTLVLSITHLKVYSLPEIY